LFANIVDKTVKSEKQATIGGRELGLPLPGHRISNPPGYTQIQSYDRTVLFVVLIDPLEVEFLITMTENWDKFFKVNF
jgi:hypothetical protein